MIRYFTPDALLLTFNRILTITPVCGAATGAVEALVLVVWNTWRTSLKTTFGVRLRSVVPAPKGSAVACARAGPVKTHARTVAAKRRLVDIPRRYGREPPPSVSRWSQVGLRAGEFSSSQSI